MLRPRSFLCGFLLAAGAASAQELAFQSFDVRLPAGHPCAATLAGGRATGLAAADFDGDGVLDLAIAYRLGGEGAIAVFRGEYAALYPNFPAGVARRQALGGRVAPFDPEPLWATPAAADFLAAGDFDADGRADLIAASGAAAQLELRRGDGHGGFGAAEIRALPAPPSALGAFDLDRADGLPELAAAVDGGTSRQVIVLGGPRGAWPAAARSWALERRATRLAAGLLGDDAFYDLAIGDAEGWRQLPGSRDGELAALRPLATPAGETTVAPESPAALELRLDDNARPDFVRIGADGRVGFEIHGLLATFVVNTTSDTDDGACDAAHCSLREAIQAANASPGPDAITFAIPGSPPYRIEPATELPWSYQSISIDGSSQPGFAGSPIVEIHSSSSLIPRGLWVNYTGAQSSVRSLVVNGFVYNGAGTGIGIDAPDSVVESCFVGTDVAGVTAIPNGNGIYFGLNAHHGRSGGTAPGAGNLASGQLGSGISMNGTESRSQGNIVGLDRWGDQMLGNFYGIGGGGAASVVGGTEPGAGNLVSGQAGSGVAIGGEAIRVQGNRIGTDASGELARPNRGAGLATETCANCLVGGTSSAAANLISGNLGGLSFWNNVTGSAVEGNRFGVSASGAPLGNAGAALVINGSRNRVGSADPAGGNLIAYNDVGIRCLGAGARHILGNSIYANNSINIECGFPPPTLIAASSTAAGTLVEGAFQGVASQGYRIEFFSTESCGSGYPPGRYLLGYQNLATDSSGNALFSFATATAVPAGQVITATANPLPLVPGPTDSLPATGFSSCRTVVAGSPAGSPTLSIPQHIPAAAFGDVTVPVLFEANGHAIGALAFSVDLGSCLSFDPADADRDQIPDAVALHLPAGWSATVSFQPGDADGELDFAFFDLPPFVPLASGAIVEIALGVTCSTNTSPIVTPLPFSSAPAPSFGNTAGQSVAGTVAGGSIDILPGLRGDCNGDGRVDAGDLTACGLELFDGDGDFWLDVPGGSFPGIPVGCDSNADTVVDAGDLACKVRLIFGLSCGDPLAPGLGVAPTVAAGGAETLAAGAARVPVYFDPGAYPVAAAVFALDLAPGVRFDPADDDADGIPDSVRIFYGGNLRQVSYHPEDPAGELRVILGDLAADPRLLPHGKLLEVTLDPGGMPAGSALVVATRPAPSFGTREGASVPSALSTLFFDGFESGNTGAWSGTLP